MCWRAVINMVLLIQKLCRSLRREPWRCTHSAAVLPQSRAPLAAHRPRNTTFKEEFEKVTAQACRIAIRECAFQRSAGRAGDALRHAGPPLKGYGSAVAHVRTVNIRFQAAIARSWRRTVRSVAFVKRVESRGFFIFLPPNPPTPPSRT